jgi:hypothetical protein
MSTWFDTMGGTFSLPGSSRLLLLIFAIDSIGFRFLLVDVDVNMFSDWISVSSNTTVALPPRPSPSRMDGARRIPGRLGADEERQVVSKDGFLMFSDFGDKGARLLFSAKGIRTPELTADETFAC